MEANTDRTPSMRSAEKAPAVCTWYESGKKLAAAEELLKPFLADPSQKNAALVATLEKVQAQLELNALQIHETERWVRAAGTFPRTEKHEVYFTLLLLQQHFSPPLAVLSASSLTPLHHTDPTNICSCTSRGQRMAYRSWMRASTKCWRHTKHCRRRRSLRHRWS